MSGCVCVVVCILVCLSVCEWVWFVWLDCVSVCVGGFLCMWMGGNGWVFLCVWVGV